MEFILLALIPLGLSIGAVLGWLAFNRTRELEQRLAKLQQQVWRLQEEQLYSRDGKVPANPPARPAVSPAKPVSTAQGAPAPAKAQAAPATSPPQPRDWQWLNHLKEHWMIWLGGGCIGLAGVFMVRYGIEQGLLGPTARIVLAIVAGLLLHAAAEYLYRRSGPHPSLAALAGGASITLYAALLAALHLYQLITPGLVFVLLAVLSFATMLLALRHGPVMAGIGVLGAYVVPLLVSTGSSNVTGALVYVVIVSAAALALQRQVNRHWLWLGVLAGMVSWGVLALAAPSAEGFRPVYLALVAYALLAIPRLDFTLNASKVTLASLSWKTLLAQPNRHETAGLLVLLALLGLSLSLQPFSFTGFILHLPFVGLLFVAARWRDDLCALPWLSALVLGAASLVSDWIHLPPDMVVRFWGCMVAIALFSGASSWLLRQGRRRAVWASLALLSPILWFTVTYLAQPQALADWMWASLVLLLGGGYVFVASQQLNKSTRSGQPADVVSLWLLLAGHAAYAVAVSMAFQEAGLTLAFALQLVSLCWMIKRYQLQAVDWLVKLLVAVVVVRLTLNPWIFSYADNPTHWSLWTYGGATACAIFAARQLSAENPLRAWLEAASLHLLVLTIGAETRYWLYDGAIFIGRFSYLEAAINVNLWAGLALAYHYRRNFSQQLAFVYNAATRVLLCLSLVAFGLLLTVHNPYFGFQPVSETPIFNSLLLAYGLPILMAWLVARYYFPQWQTVAYSVAAASAFVFINLQIRHLWNGAVNEFIPMSSGELYTYSLVWLLIAIGVVIQATRSQETQLYRVGMCMLLAVIAKIFLVDMSGLAGLLRVASFMGLGLALLGLSFLHKRLSAEAV